MYRLPILLWLLAVSACSEAPPKTAFLTFSEAEPGGESYPVRMLVTEQYLRIEDGDGKSGYILFDRAARTIYSIRGEASPAGTELQVGFEPLIVESTP